MDTSDPLSLGRTDETAWQRLHRSLMPDYNARATTYWWSMLALGVAVVAHAVWTVSALPREEITRVVGGVALAVAAGFFPISIPRSKNSFVAGEIFIFLLMLLHGSSAAILAAACESFVGAFRSSMRWTSRIISPALSAVAMLCAGSMFDAVSTVLDSHGAFGAATLPLISMLMAVVYFVANSSLVLAVLQLKSGSSFDVRALASSFGPVGLAYGGAALVAALLHQAVQASGLVVLFGALPVIALLLTIVHFALRQQQAADEIRRSRVEAAEREAEQAARHMVALSASEQRFHSAFTHASIGMALVAFDGRILQANKALLALLGLPRGQGLVGEHFANFVDAEDLRGLEHEFARIHGGDIEAFSLELRCPHPTHDRIWVSLNAAHVHEPGSAAPCLILQVQDISARRNAEAQLNHLAFHDALTGLPNRRRFHQLLARALAAAQRDPTQHFAVMFLDFDRFKLINDSLGHSVGDEFLVQVSHRIHDKVRPGDVVARLGGDEFAVLVQGIESDACATHLAERLQQVLKQPMVVSGVSVSTSASIGITYSRHGYADSEHLLRDADIAMYRAKAAGKARHAVFDRGQLAQVSDRLRLESDLRQALAEGDIEVAYQPLQHLGSGRLLGFEALARWNHPLHGAIHPDAFIPVAEECGLMVELTDLVLHRACHQARQWQSRDASLQRLTMNINLSGNDLGDARLAERVERALRESRLAPELLRLELTENILMQRVDGALDTLGALRRIGIGLAIDDFGTGYSSLSYLSSLPIDSLKIDRSFVQGMQSGSKDAEIVRAVVSLGATLGKAVVAEGIETQSQLTQLQQLGCEGGQGYYLSRPMWAGDVDDLLDGLIAEPQLAAGACPGAGTSAAAVRH